MNTLRTLAFAILALSAPFTSAAEWQHGVGNGGDDLVIAIRRQATFIGLRWQQMNSVCRSRLPVTADRFLETYAHADIRTTDEQLTLNSIHKDAINYPDDNVIVFNRFAIRSMDATFLIHEGLGLLRVKDDAYSISELIARMIYDPFCLSGVGEDRPTLAGDSSVPASFVPAAAVIDQAGVIYLLDDSRSALYRYDMGAQTYLKAIPLGAGAIRITYSSDLKRLYVGYADGTVTFFDAKKFDREYSFTLLGGPMDQFQAMGTQLFLTKASQNNGVGDLCFYDVTGRLVSSEFAPSAYADSVWLPEGRKLFYRMAFSLMSDIVGYRSFDGTHWRKGVELPPRELESKPTPLGDLTVSVNHVIAANGTLFTGTLKYVKTLPLRIKRGIWLGDTLLAIAEGPTGEDVRQTWRPPYDTPTTLPAVTGANALMLLRYGTAAVLISAQGDGLRFESLRY